jgi:hypothetical protein
MRASHLERADVLADRNSASPAGNAQGWADPIGDAEAGLAPDVTTVGLANDDLGAIGMRIDTPNWQYLISGTFVGVFMDTDQNALTGDSTGSDYAIAIDGDTNTIGLARWNGSTWDFSVPQSTLSGSWGYGATVAINRSDLSTPTGMNFWIGASWTGIGTYYDFAPDAGLPSWNYQIVVAPPPPPPPPPPLPPPPPPPPQPPPPPPPPPRVRCTVPRVVGLRLAPARTKIRRAHCSVGRIRRVRSRKVGRVISQSPRAGVRRAKGARVNLSVGRN